VLIGAEGHGCSGQKRADDVTFHVGQAVIAAGEAVRQTFVVEPEQVQYRGVQVVHVHLVNDRLVAEFIRVAMSITSFDTSARQPARP
jgi:hypothetical protein